MPIKQPVITTLTIAKAKTLPKKDFSWKIILYSLQL